MHFIWIVFIAISLEGCIKKSSDSESKGLVGKNKATHIARVAADPDDPFRPFGLSATMKKGRDKGKAIDIDWRRSVRVVDAATAKEYFSDFDPATELAIANVKEYSNFYVARFKKDALNQVFLNKERLFEKVGVHHTGLRFVLRGDEKFELVPQKKGSNAKAKSYSYLSFGVFALGVPGKYFGPKNSVKGDLVSAYMFFTPPEQASRARDLPINYSMDEIEFDKIKAPRAIYKLFFHLATEGDRLGYDEIYGMFLNNCVHRLLALIREALPKYRSDGIIDKILLSAFNTDILPTGIANGFSGVIKSELKRAGATSKNADWRQFWEIKDLVSYLDVLDCSQVNGVSDLRAQCSQMYLKKPHIIPDRIKQQQNYLFDKCVSRNQFLCLKK